MTAFLADSVPSLESILFWDLLGPVLAFSAPLPVLYFVWRGREKPYKEALKSLTPEDREMVEQASKSGYRPGWFLFPGMLVAAGVFGAGFPRASVVISCVVPLGYFVESILRQRIAFQRLHGSALAARYIRLLRITAVASTLGFTAFLSWGAGRVVLKTAEYQHRHAPGDSQPWEAK